MPGGQLTLLSRLNEYVRVTKGEKARRLGKSYSDFVDMLEILNNVSAEYYRQDESGKCKTLGAGDVENLKACYTTVLIAAHELLNKKKPNKAERRYNVVVKQIKNLLEQDSEVINALSDGAGQTLPALVRSARSRQVSVNAGNVATIGEMSSQRIPLRFTDENGNERKGFFSETHILEKDSEKVSKEYVERRLNEHKDDNWRYKDVFQAILDKGTFGYSLIIDLTVGDNAMQPGVYSDFLRKYGLSEQKITEFENDIGLNKELSELTQLTLKTERNQFLYESGTVGSGIESRNTAFSAVAEALGRDSLIAKSEVMELSLNGKELHGSFMATAAGSDCHRPAENDPMVTWAKAGVKKTARGYENTGLAVSPEALRQLADLDVLDYICGNRDRHSGNMLYQFDTSDAKKPVLIGVTGIDNDRSFLVSEPDKGTVNVTLLDDISYVSESMAAKIMGMTKGQLAFRLADKQLSAAEIDAVFGRIEEMQKRILKGSAEFTADDDLYAHKDGAVRVLSDEQFKKLDFNKLIGKEPNVRTIFGRTFDGAKSALSHHAKLAEKKSFDNSKIEYNRAEVTHSLRPDEAKGLSDKLDGFRNDLIENDHFYLINSPKFNAMKNSLNNLRRAVEEGYNDEAELEEYYSDLSAKCQHYIDAKGNLPNTEYGQNRLEAARQMRDYAKERISAIHDPMAQSLKRSKEAAGELRHKLFMCSLTQKNLREAEYNYKTSKNKSAFLLNSRVTAAQADRMYLGLLMQNASKLFVEMKAQEEFKKTFDPGCFSPENREEIKQELESGLFLEKYCNELRSRPGAEAIKPEEFFKDITDKKAEYDAPSRDSSVFDEDEKQVNVSDLMDWSLNI